MEDLSKTACERYAAVCRPPLPSPAYENIEILLASNSPRRRELLGLIVPQFTIAPPKVVDECYPDDLVPEEVPAYLSRLKASAYKGGLAENQLLITADTVVIIDGRILGKPKGYAEAVAMLGMLSGRSHTVVTGVTLTALGGRKNDTFAVSTEVRFAHLDEAEIEAYVSAFRPFDKAGAYGIQEWIGAAAIEGMVGSFYNVMGLPLHALYLHLRSFYS